MKQKQWSVGVGVVGGCERQRTDMCADVCTTEAAAMPQTYAPLMAAGTATLSYLVQAMLESRE